MTLIADILQHAVNTRASDIHLRAQVAPRFRIDGKLAVSELPPIPGHALLAFHSEKRPSAVFNHDDFAFEMHGQSWRANASDNLNGPALIIRQIMANVPPLGKLGVPPEFTRRIQQMSGLHLLTGPTGCGKSTTLAAVVRFLAQQPIKIIELADPIEHRHPQDLPADIQQRELGIHFTDYVSAVRAALRQDPDVLLIGEMRDKETIRAALTAASTGHMVFSTMHNETAPDAVRRLLEASYDNEQTEHRSMVAKELATCIAQQLVPLPTGGSMPIFELFVMTDATANLIRSGQVERLSDEIMRGEKHGMVSMTNALGTAVRAGTLPHAAARSAASDHKLFDLLVPLRK
jgi:twitching motility protein PilT